MPAGRPRTLIPNKEEVIKLGEEMVQWVTVNRPLHLTQWWRIEKFITSPVWEAMLQTKEFTPYYEQALSIIGLQYLDKESRIRDGISQRWQRVYFKDLRAQEDADMDAEAERKKQVVESIDQESLAKFASFMDQVSSIQRKSALNTCDINNSDEAKS